jgi:mannose-1-phosphate guanylyltransferase
MPPVNPTTPTPEAVIVAGGFGTRMLPLTERRPKHLLEVGGVAFLEHQISKLADAGVDHVVLATSYQAHLFRPVLGDGSRFGVELDYVTEEEPLGTAGAIRNVVDHLDVDPSRPVVVLNGDVLSGHDLRAQLDDFERHRDGRDVEVSLHLVEVPDARAFGCVPTDDDGRVLGFVEKSDQPVTNQVNAGCYVFRRGILDRIPPGQVVSVERETFPELIDSGVVVVGYVESAYWRDVGSPSALAAASRDLVTGVAVSPATAARPAAEAWLDPTAEVEGELLGGSTALSGVVVGPGAAVRGSVLMRGAHVAPGALVTDSVVGPGARVGSGARLDGAAVGDEAVVADGAVLEPGERVACGARRS